MLRAMLSNSAVHPVASGPTQQLMANASSNNIDHPPQLAAKDVNPAASGGAMNAKLITVVAPRDISKPTAPPVTGNVYRAEASVAPEAAAEEYPDYDSECPICMETFEEPLRLPCSHTFCRGCLRDLRCQTCPTCRADLPVEFRESAASRVVDDARQQLEAERQMIIDAMGGAVKGCPACGSLIEKIDGDHQVMCGCEAKPAGGTLAKALAGGGCGHCWDFRNGNAIEHGKPGQPYNERQVYYYQPQEGAQRSGFGGRCSSGSRARARAGGSGGGGGGGGGGGAESGGGGGGGGDEPRRRRWPPWRNAWRYSEFIILLTVPR